MTDEMKTMETTVETKEAEMPVLILPGEDVTPMDQMLTEAAEKPETIKEVNIEDKIQLTDAEKKAVEDFAAKIDISNSNHILQYGADAQAKITQFSDMALEKVRAKDLGSVGEALSDLVVELKGFDPNEQKKGFLGLFKKAGTGIAQLKAKYDKVEVNVEKVVDILEGHQKSTQQKIHRNRNKCFFGLQGKHDKLQAAFVIYCCRQEETRRSAERYNSCNESKSSGKRCNGGRTGGKRPFQPC